MAILTPVLFFFDAHPGHSPLGSVAWTMPVFDVSEQPNLGAAEGAAGSARSGLDAGLEQQSAES